MTNASHRLRLLYHLSPVTGSDLHERSDDPQPLGAVVDNLASRLARVEASSTGELRCCSRPAVDISLSLCIFIFIILRGRGSSLSSLPSSPTLFILLQSRQLQLTADLLTSRLRLPDTSYCLLCVCVHRENNFFHTFFQKCKMNLVY